MVTAAALVSLSLAIGACTAAFSLIDALILRTLPVDDPRSLVYLALRTPAEPRDGLSFNYPLFRELRAAGSRQVRLFAVSDQSRRDATFDDSGQAEKVYGQWVSGDAFTILGVKPALGRVLAPSDDVNPGRHPVAVLSYDFWTRRFGGNPDVLGRWVTIRQKSLQIVGVAAKGFTGVEPGIMTDVWAPTMMWDDRAIADPDTRWFKIWGRMEAGVAEEQAQAVLQTVLTNFRRAQAARLPEESPDRIEQFLNTRVHLRSAANGPSGLRENFARALWVLGALAALVLLIACANIASLLVARATARQREMAVRASIGAGRGRLIQQALIESGLLALTSCALGAVLAVVATPKLVSMIGTSNAVVRLDVGLDWRVLGFLGGVGILVTFLFGLPPALHASAVPPAGALRSGGRHATHAGLFRPLVAAQIAFSFVVLFVAGLSLTSFVKLLRTDLGFDASNVALVNVTATPGRPDSGQTLATWINLLERVEHTPGVESASLSGWGLFTGSGRNKSVRIPGRTIDGYMPWYLPVSPGFLQTMRIPLMAGRDLEWRDAQPEQPTAVIVNESFARRYFPGESAVGKRFLRVDGGAVLVEQEVVGVARDAKYTDLREPAPPTVYDPYRPQDAAVIQVRTRLEMAPLLAALAGRSAPCASRVPRRWGHAPVHDRRQPPRAGPCTGAALRVLLPGGGRTRDCRRLRRPQLHRASADAGNRHPARPRRTAAADRAAGAVRDWRHDAHRPGHRRNRRCPRRPVHDDGPVRRRAVGHVEHSHAARRLADGLRIRCRRPRTSCVTNCSHHGIDCRMNASCFARAGSPSTTTERQRMAASYSMCPSHMR